MNNNISLLERTHPDLLSGNNNVNQAIIALYDLFIQFKNAQEENDLSYLAKLYIREFKDKDLQTFNICKKVADVCSEENEAFGNCGITAAMETLYNNNEKFLKKYDKYIIDKVKNKKLCDMDEYCFNKFCLGFRQHDDNKKAQNNRYYNGYYAGEIWDVLKQLNNNMEQAKNDINKVLPSGKRYYCRTGVLKEKKEKIENEKFDAMKAKAIETGGIIAEIRYDILNALQDMAKKYDEILKDNKNLEDVLKEEVNLLKSYCEIKSIKKNCDEKWRTKSIDELLAFDKSIYLPALGLGLSQIHKKTIFILGNSEGKSKLWVFDASKIDDEECKHRAIYIFEADSKDMPKEKVNLAQHYKDQIGDPSNPILFYDEEGAGHFRYLDPKKTTKRKIFKMYMSNLFLDECIKKDQEQQKRLAGAHKKIINKQADIIKDLKEQKEKLKSENSDLKNQIDKLKNEKTNLELQVKSGKNPNEEVKQRIVELEEELKNAQEKIKEQEELISILQDADNNSDDVNSKLEKEKQKLIDENAAIKKELEETNKLKSKNDDLKNQLLEKQKLVDCAVKAKKEMSNELDKVKSEHKKQSEQQEQTIETLNSKINTLESEKQKLINENATIKKELEETNKLKGSIKEENKKLRSEKENLENQLLEKQKLVDCAVKAKKEMSNELDKVKSEHKKQSEQQEQTIKTLNNKLKKLADEQKQQIQNQAREFFKQATFTNFTARKFSLIYFFAWALSWLITGCKMYVDMIRMIRYLNNGFDAFRNSPFVKNTDEIEKEMNKNTPKQVDEMFCNLDELLPILQACNNVILFNKYVLIYCSLLDLYRHNTDEIYQKLNSNLLIGFNWNLLKEKIELLKVTDNELNNSNNIDEENKNIIDTNINNFIDSKNQKKLDNFSK